MREIRVQTVVDEDHTARLRLPRDVRQGPIEVIVLVEDEPAPSAGAPLADFLDRVAARTWTGRSKVDLDRSLEEERRSWD